MNQQLASSGRLELTWWATIYHVQTDAWVTRWLSEARFQRYRVAAGGDDARALSIYRWNARMAAAFLIDLGHLEVAMRNAYDACLVNHPDLNDEDWLSAAGALVLFPKHWVGQGKERRDLHRRPRSQVETARARGLTATAGRRGKVIAEFDLNFWSCLTMDRYEKTVWVPVLHRAYPDGTDRAKLHRTITDLRDLRNRVAHHEPIFDRNAEGRRRQILFVARLLAPQLRDFIESGGQLRSIIAERPQ